MVNATERLGDQDRGELIILSLSGVTAGYGAGLILKGVDLSVEVGKIMCLIGPNGSGKSTILKTISGLLYPEGGKVILRGKDISRTLVEGSVDFGSRARAAGSEPLPRNDGLGERANGRLHPFQPGAGSKPDRKGC